MSSPVKSRVLRSDAENGEPDLADWIRPWVKVQNLAYSGNSSDDEELKRHVLEAQRIFVDQRYEPVGTHLRADLPHSYLRPA